MSDEQNSAADTATEAAVDAHISGNTEKAVPLFNRASVEFRRAAAAAENGTDPWRDGNDVAPLAPMPTAPSIETREVDSAMATLNEAGPEHAALVQNWGSDFSENLAYAKSAFRDISTNRPDLIAKFEANGLGSDPAVLAHLASFGRLSAGFSNDHTIAKRYEPMTINRTGPTITRGSGSAAQQELDRIVSEHPPGSAGYKMPRIQNRVQELHRMIAGNGSIIGSGGRTS